MHESQDHAEAKPFAGRVRRQGKYLARISPTKARAGSRDRNRGRRGRRYPGRVAAGLRHRASARRVRFSRKSERTSVISSEGSKGIEEKSIDLGIDCSGGFDVVGACAMRKHRRRRAFLLHVLIKAASSPSAASSFARRGRTLPCRGSERLTSGFDGRETQAGSSRSCTFNSRDCAICRRRSTAFRLTSICDGDLIPVTSRLPRAAVPSL